jgi:hypothetical protein
MNFISRSKLNLAARFFAVAIVVFGTSMPMLSVTKSAEPNAALASPFPDVCVPVPPAGGQCCLFRVQKRVEGERSITYNAPYICSGVETKEGDTTFKAVLGSGGAPCDEAPAVIPDGSTLFAVGNTIRRKDGFSNFVGKFSITDPLGNTLFEGTLELFERLGSHHSPFGTEVCDPISHNEGWLIGRGVNGLDSVSLRAIIVLRGQLPPVDGSTPVLGTFDGSFVRCP